MTDEPKTANAVPNPGSPVAFSKGCTCPRLDNDHGKGWAGNFWISGDCPIHARPKSPTDATPSP
jgi:hypothetical protein